MEASESVVWWSLRRFFPRPPQRLLEHSRRLAAEISHFPSTTTAGTPLIPRETHNALAASARPRLHPANRSGTTCQP